jgi:glycosyl transferase, family 25
MAPKHRHCPQSGPRHFLKGSAKLLPVLYINLEDDSERRAHIKRELAQHGLKSIRVRAFEPHFAPCGGAFADTLSPGETACYASHMKAWNTLLVSPYPFALVLEDDARVPLNLADLIAAIVEALPQYWDLVHLYDNEGRPARPLTSLGNGQKLVRYSRVPAGCVAYLISRSGAQKLSRHELRSWPLDTDFRRPWHFGVDAYGIRPTLIEHESEFSSAILRSGPRSRRRRGITFSNPLHSLQGAVWNMRKLGLRWWLQCLAINSGRRCVRAIRKLPLSRVPPAPHRAAMAESGTSSASAPTPGEQNTRPRGTTSAKTQRPGGTG